MLGPVTTNVLWDLNGASEINLSGQFQLDEVTCVVAPSIQYTHFVFSLLPVTLSPGSLVESLIVLKKGNVNIGGLQKVRRRLQAGLIGLLLRRLPAEKTKDETDIVHDY